MSFFTKSKYINHVNQTPRTNKIITRLYHDILNAYNYLLTLKQNMSSPANKSQLWDLIGQITVQVDQLMDQDPETKMAL